MILRPRRLHGIRQQDSTDCGPACLAAITQYHGRAVPLTEVRLAASTNERGTTVAGLIAAAERLGFSASGVRGSNDSLGSVPAPAIAHVVVGGVLNHFVVLVRVSSTSVRVMDPRDGRIIRISRAAFAEEWTGVLVILRPRPSLPSLPSRPSLSRRLFHLVRPHRGLLLQAVIGAMCYALLGLSTTIFVQKLIDNVLTDGNRNLLNLLGAAMVTLLAVQTYIGVAKNFYTLRTGQAIDGELIMGYCGHLLRLPQRFFDSMPVGEVLSRVNDAVKIRAFLNDAAIEMVANGMIVVFSLGMMFIYSWRLALLTAAALPLIGAIYWLANRANRKIRRRLMEDAADLESQLVESLQGVQTLKRFGVEQTAFAGIERRFVRVLRSVRDAGCVGILASGSTEVATRGIAILVLWIGSMLVLDRHVTAGQLMSLYTLVGYMSGPLIALMTANRSIQDALIASDRLFDIMDVDSEKSNSRMVDLTPHLIGDIRFENVSFQYGSRTKVLEGLNLTIPRGSLTAIVGESGSGKTTLAALLQMLYPVTSGRIRIGAVDLANLSIASVRSLVVAVPQEIHLFTGSVLENIALGDPSPDMLRVVTIAEELGLSEVVEKLPAGFQTRLGHHGVGLSTGQKQRLAIARALYRRPEILILDEPTSALDMRSEAFVRRALDRLREEGRTVILVAHRLSTVIDADAIAVLRLGAVAEMGTHRDLMARRGAYYELWGQQLQTAA